AGPEPQAEEEQVNVPYTKSEWDKTPRNAPCPCGSGKKYKLCHGREPLAMRDFSDDVSDLRRRLDEAKQYLRIDELRARRPQLETEASRPDLWDDQDLARKVTGELNQVTSDLEMYEGLVQRVDDAETLAELAR